MKTYTSRAMRASITFNSNLNSKKPTFLSKQGGTKIINYYQKFKLDLLFLGKVDYNSISSKTETYSTLLRQGGL